MSLLLQDLVVTSITAAVAIVAVARLVTWKRTDRKAACANCPACADRSHREAP